MTLEKIVLDHPDFTPPPLPLSSSTTAPPTPPAPPARISPSPAASWVLVLSKWCQLIAQQPLRAWQLGRPRTLLHLNQRGFKGGVTSFPCRCQRPPPSPSWSSSSKLISHPLLTRFQIPDLPPHCKTLSKKLGLIFSPRLTTCCAFHLGKSPDSHLNAQVNDSMYLE